MEGEQTPNPTKLPLQSIENAVAAAELALNPEKIRRILDLLAEAKKVNRECLYFQFII